MFSENAKRAHMINHTCWIRDLDKGFEQISFIYRLSHSTLKEPFSVAENGNTNATSFEL